MKTYASKSQGKSGNVKKSLHTLQPAATGGKENLVGGRRTVNDIKSKIAEDDIDTLKTGGSVKRGVTEDLTSKAGPSEKYWEEIAERRRLALEEALKENKFLHDQVKLLGEENTTLREMIKDSADIINYVNEAIEEQYSSETTEEENSPKIEKEENYLAIEKKSSEIEFEMERLKEIRKPIETLDN